MTVTLPKRLRDQFRRRALKAFPAECFAYLLGRRYGEDTWDVVALHFPSQIADEGAVHVTLEDHVAALEAAAKRRLVLFGSIHTHCYRYSAFKGGEFEPVLSIGDINGWESSDVVGGVMNVTEVSPGRKRCGDIVMWVAPPEAAEVQIT